MLVGSESGFILANKGREIFDSGIRVSRDLYKETGKEEHLLEAFLWALKAGDISLHANRVWEELSKSYGSLQQFQIRLYRIRDALTKPVDSDIKKALLLEYQALKKKVSYVWNHTGVNTKTKEQLIGEISLGVGRKQFLCYHQLDSVFLVFRLSNGNLSLGEFSISKELTEQTDRLMKILTQENKGNYPAQMVIDFERNSHQLCQTILMPFLCKIPSNRLLIRPDGLLNGIPFEALVIDHTRIPGSQAKLTFKDLNMVINEYCISYFTVSSTFPNQKTNSRRSGIYILRCSGDRIAPEIDNEVTWIEQNFKRSVTMELGDLDLNSDTLMSHSPMIHFAGHIHLDRNEEMGTTLGCGDTESKSIRFSELLFNHLDADLVFINGCESAGGMPNRGDGNLSPGFFFLLAGAKGVVEHNWIASDLSSSLLAQGFYTRLKIQGPSKALRNSKIDYLSQCKPGLDHPHYWAGMIYSGIPETYVIPFLHLILYLIGLIGLAALLYWLIRKTFSQVFFQKTGLIKKRKILIQNTLNRQKLLKSKCIKNCINKEKRLTNIIS